MSRLNLLLDTHVLLWLLGAPDRVPAATRQLLRDPSNTVLVSAASAWEIAIKTSLGRVALPSNLAGWFPAHLERSGFTPLAITVAHALGVERLPRHHADPFDRLLISQAQQEGASLVSADRKLTPYDVRLVWG